MQSDTQSFAVIRVYDGIDSATEEGREHAGDFKEQRFC